VHQTVKESVEAGGAQEMCRKRGGEGTRFSREKKGKVRGRLENGIRLSQKGAPGERNSVWLLGADGKKNRPKEEGTVASLGWGLESEEGTPSGPSRTPCYSSKNVQGRMRNKREGKKGSSVGGAREGRASAYKLSSGSTTSENQKSSKNG